MKRSRRFEWANGKLLCRGEVEELYLQDAAITLCRESPFGVEERPAAGRKSTQSVPTALLLKEDVRVLCTKERVLWFTKHTFFFFLKAAFAFIIIPTVTSHGPFSPGFGKKIQAPQALAKQRA